MDLFDISDTDVALLNDEDLRRLVGLLCEAEYRRTGRPLSNVTWGGDQNASDGGIDVSIISENSSFIDFIPRSRTVYQVKKSDLTPAGIRKEMRPGNLLRQSIKELIRHKGAYIIVSASSLTKSSLERRIKAMRNAVARHRGSQELLVDFFDSSKLATWVRSHPSMTLWLRNKVGRPLKGWMPFCNWSGKPGTNADEYLLDDGLRIRHTSDSSILEMTSLEGIERMRLLLSEPKATVRLIGLSGVGKTRFAQALFEVIGNNPLDPSLAIYTDLSSSPNPDPVTLAQQINTIGFPAILVIDNCPPTLHKQLVGISTSPTSSMRLLTIEYDVRDDLPEETEVFLMEPSSDKLIQKMIENLFREIGFLNAKTIADFSGGNARIAIALARTVIKGEALSSLRDDDLFNRLFRQRDNQRDDMLIRVAEVCSLLYSFEGTKTDDNSEISFLGKIIGADPKEIYRNVSELKRRNIIQSRGVWRAVLPHAIANRLAKKCLESIPLNSILNPFEQSGTKRLFISFSRRLGFLHNSQHAIMIAEDWLKADGWLGKSKGDLNEFGMRVLSNIASLSPESVLEFIERSSFETDNFLSRSNSNFRQLVKLLRLMAYEADLFSKSVDLLCRFALTERIDENQDSIHQQLGKLFQIYLSGSHATARQRGDVIDALLVSQDEKEQDLGVFLLGKALQTGSFTGMDYGFGARTRDYGFQPKNWEQFENWFSIFIGICTTYACREGRLKEKVRDLLGNNFRGLWRHRLYELMESASIKISQSAPWSEGWVGIKSIFMYDLEHFPVEVLDRLKVLEILLRPTTLIDKARTITLKNRHNYFDFDVLISDRAGIENTWKKMHATARDLGALVAKDRDAAEQLLPKLLSTENERLLSFGEGFANGAFDLYNSFEECKKVLRGIPAESRTYRFILGFLKGSQIRDNGFYHATMDSLVDDEILASIFPYFQASLGVDALGIPRLKKSLDLGKADIKAFRNLEFGWFDDSVTEASFIDLLSELMKRPNGILIVVEILHFRLSNCKELGIVITDEMENFVREVLSKYPFDGSEWESNDHSLAYLASQCLKNNEAVAKQLCKHIKASFDKGTIYYAETELTKSLAIVQPFIFMDEFIGAATAIDPYFNSGENNPIDKISDNVIEAWALRNRSSIPNIITHINTTYQSAQGKLTWRPVIKKLLITAPDVQAFLNKLEESVSFLIWNGSGSITQDGLRALFDDLIDESDGKEIRSWAKRMELKFTNLINTETDNERNRRRMKNETFE